MSGSDRHPAAQRGQIESRLAPPLYRGTTLVTLSESSKVELVDEMGFRSDRVRVVHPGVDASFTPGGARAPAPLVLAVGRLQPRHRTLRDRPRHRRLLQLNEAAGVLARGGLTAGRRRDDNGPARGIRTGGH